MTTPNTNPAGMTDEQFIDGLQRASVAIYLATEALVADDISWHLREAARRLRARSQPTAEGKELAEKLAKVLQCEFHKRGLEYKHPTEGSSPLIEACTLADILSPHLSRSDDTKNGLPADEIRSALVSVTGSLGLIIAGAGAHGIGHKENYENARRILDASWPSEYDHFNAPPTETKGAS